MKPNTTNKNNQGINTTTKALINPKCLQIYNNNHAFSALINNQGGLWFWENILKRGTCFKP